MEAHLEEQIKQLTVKVDKISEALLGNEFNQHGGLVKIINTHEKRISDIEDAGIESHEMRLKILEDSKITHTVYVNILKFIAAIIATGVITFILSIVLKK